jgi:SEC-C motif domain protein
VPVPPGIDNHQPHPTPERLPLPHPERMTGLTRAPGSPAVHELAGAQPDQPAGATQVPSDPPAPGHLLSRPSMRPCQNVRMDGLACPCGLGDGYESCCGRLHAGAPAPTAESLMRSRYSAYAAGDAGYLLRTWHPSARPRTLSLDPALRWTRLAVLETRDGGLFDATGTVQFRAMYVQQGQRGVLAETSRFVRHDRHWTYLGPIG